MMKLSIGNVTDIKNPTISVSVMVLWTIQSFVWRKGDVYEKMWRVDACIQSAVKVRYRRIFEGSL